MHEREHDHAHANPEAATHTTDLAPGHSNRSAQLNAPANPIVSGLIRRKARDANGVAEGAEQAVAAASSSSGHSLPEPIMRKFESSLGADLSSVRVHTGSESQAATASVGAKAYTVGQDIHFGAGHYDPSSSSGEHLLAHEVAHTVQQTVGPQRRQNKLEVSMPQDAAEHEADRAADAMIAGQPALVSSGGGLARQTVSRLFDEYSSDPDLKQLPRPASFKPADGSFGAMASAVQQAMLGNDTAVVAPASGFAGSIDNLIECRNNAESAYVYYSHHAPSKWNPFGDKNVDAYAKAAQGDANWAITMLASVRVAGSATGSWVALANASNTAWADVVKQAKAMSIEVGNKQDKVPLAGLADGKDHFKQGDQQINQVEVGGAGMGLGVEAKKAGLKAPDTSGYKKAMQDYNEARNELAPQQQRIITTLIPTNIASIKAHKQESEEEKDKWKTIAEATGIFEKGLTGAFGGPALLEATGSLATTEEGIAKPDLDVNGGVAKGVGLLSKVIEMRVAAIQRQIDRYNENLKNYTDVQEAMSLKASVGEHKNGLVKLARKAKNVEEERTKMEKAFMEFAKSIDEAMIKKGKAPKGSDNNQQAARLLSGLRTAATTTQGAVDGLSSGGSADLPGLYSELAQLANSRKEDQTGGDGRRDKRSDCFAIEGRRWSGASAAIGIIQAELARRQNQVNNLETEFLNQFANASGGTDSIK